MLICPTCQCTVPDGETHCPKDGTQLVKRHAWSGKVLGDRYRIISKLGQGGMGTVFVAEHVILGKRMAVKVLREDLSRDEDLVRRFQQEAISASQIGHENIVNITDFGRSPEGALYFVMEKLDGESLTDLVRREGALSGARAVPLLVQICKALGAAHARGIVHRDLKPDNVMIVRREDGSPLVKVLDFGISKVNAKGSEKLTRVGMLMGTPEYMAPEQVEASSVDHRVDIYSLGALAYELLTGSVPFQANTPVAILMMHRSELPQPLREKRPDLPIPEALEACILKALSKAAGDRQQSMAEMAQELQAAVGMTGTLPPRASPIPLSHAVPAAAPQFAGASRGGTMQLSSSELAAPAAAPAQAPAATQTPAPAARTPAPAARTPAPAASTPAPAPAPGSTLITSPAPTTPPQAPRPPTPRPREAPPVSQTLMGEDADLRAVRRGPNKGVLAAVAALVVLLGVGGFLFTRQSPEAAPAPPPPVKVATPEPPPAPVPTPPEPKAPEVKPPEPPPAPALLTVQVRSEPSGATVWTRKGKVGVTPLALELAEGERQEYRFTLAGHRPVRKAIAASDGTVEVRLKERRKRGDRRKQDPAEEEEDPFQKIDDLKENPF